MKAENYYASPVFTTSEIKAMTDGNGIAIFSVEPASTPDVFFFLDSGQCSAIGPYRVENIVRLGLVAENRCLQRSPRLKDLAASPGQITIFRETWSSWDRLKHLRDPPPLLGTTDGR